MAAPVYQDVGTVLIVGGGIGGMSAAICLARGGAQVRLVEQTEDWRALGAGLTLNGMSLRALLDLGVLDAVRAQAHIHGGRRTIGPADEILVDIPVYTPTDGEVTAGGGILRPALHDTLRDAAVALGVVPHLGTTVTALEQDADGVAVTLADGYTGRFDLVIGADGVRSVVRGLAMPDAPQPRFTGQGCWRAIFPRPASIEAPLTVLGRVYTAGMRPVSNDEIYLNLLEHVPDNPWRDEAEWPALLAARLATFDGLVGSLGRKLDDTSRVNYRPLETIMVPLPWHVDRIVLLGDAVHATTPHAAYGAGLAIEDALVLADALAQAGPLEGRLRLYEALRFERCRDIVQAALDVGELEMRRATQEEWIAGAAKLRDRILTPLPTMERARQSLAA